MERAVRRGEKCSLGRADCCTKAERLKRTDLLPGSEIHHGWSEECKRERGERRGETEQQQAMQGFPGPAGRVDLVFYYGAVRNHGRGRKEADLGGFQMPVAVKILVKQKGANEASSPFAE